MGTLRILYALTVVFAHSELNGGVVFVGGENAVRAFYIISGFLISYVLNTRKDYENVGKFYLSRALRIYPAYYAVALLTLLGIIVARTNFFSLYGAIPVSADALLVISNALIIGQDWVMFLGVSENKMIVVRQDGWGKRGLFQGLLVPQAWTLGLELSFYLVAPFIVKSTKMISVLLICSVVLRLLFILFGFDYNDPWTHRFFPFELALFLAGSLSERVLLPLWETGLLQCKYRKQILWSTMATTVGYSLAYFVVPLSEIYKMGILVSMLVLFMPVAFAFQNAYAWDRKIGELSYPLYIGHILVVWVNIFVAKKVNWTGKLAPTFSNVLFSLIFGYLINRLICSPMEGFRHRLSGRRSARKDINSSIL